MSDQPPPGPPYEPPPGPPPPSGPPPGYGQYPYQPPSGGGMSNKAKFWIGVALAIPALLVGGVVTGVLGALGSAIDPGDGTVSGVLGLVGGVLELAAIVLLIVWQKTRWFAVGALAGIAVLFVLAAGACVVLLVAISHSYS